MAAEKPTISARQVLSLLDEMRQNRELDQAQLEQRRAYRQAAAVLARIDNLASLKPVGVSPSEPATDLLRDDLVAVKSKGLEGTWTLATDVRRQALTELAKNNALAAALAANPQERTGPVQAQLERYLQGTAKPLEQQSLAELEDSLQALLWIEGVPVEHPSLDQVRRRLDYLRLLAPLESLAGDAVFRGRQHELDALRRYVGVLPPASLLARLTDKATAWARPLQQPALSVFGPGGVGKSALVARFMLEHTRLPEAARIPFAYLDFDRPTLDISRPLTLCGEMISQLRLQFPDYEWIPDFGRLEAIAAKSEDPFRVAASALADLLGLIEYRLGPRPYVVTLDTFEEVQYRGEARAFPLWELLGGLQRQRPFLRVVVSGRAPVNSLRLADKSTESLEIGPLDKEGAVAFLQAQGVDDEDVAAKVFAQVGGVPLSLKLAAALLKRDGVDPKSIRNLSGRATFWFSASDEMIQGQLFERLLGHIHNPRVERLAHPGLVVRRITPGVILNVLNEPCALAITSLKEAQALFDELRRETALVMVQQGDDAEELVHRPDLRRIMLKLLIQKAPAQVRDIHLRAAAWYSKQRGLRARAEALYHRLQLGEAIDAEALRDRSIRFSIQTSIAELPVQSQLRLASLGLDVDKEILERASREQMDAAMAAKIEALLPFGPSSVAEAAKIADSMLQQARGASAAYRAAARVALQQGEANRGLQLLEQGLSLSIPENNTIQTLELLREKAWGLRGSPDQDATLVQLAEYAQRHQSRSASFQQHAQSYAARRAAEIGRAPAAEMLQLLASLSSLELWELVPAVGLVIRGLAAAETRLPEVLRPKLIDENGPFRLAVFPDTRAHASLEALINIAVRGWQKSGIDARTEVVAPFEHLCELWPYRVLQVQPPYGSRGTDRLAEAV